MPESRRKKTLVVGLGKSGISACRFLVKRGFAVVAIDMSETETLRRTAEELGSIGVEVHLGTTDLPLDVERVVTSPGVPLERLAVLREKKIPIVGELELGCQEIQVPLIAVTGTNGKSTVVTNTEKALVAAGRRARALGNLGTPVTEWVDREEEVDLLVLEVSSYQLETIRTFRPRVAVILNVAPDHLERHKSMESYLAAKSRVAENQTIEDALLLHKDLAEFSQLQKTRGRLYWYGRDLPPSRDGLSLGGSVLTWRGEGPEWSGEICCEGLFAHEIDNLMATVAVLLLIGVSSEEAVRAFEKPIRLPHRLELVSTRAGVCFLNDSKATNVHAAVAALHAVSGPTLWLVGGEGKGEDLSGLADMARMAGVKKAVCFGRDREIFARALRQGVPVEIARTMREAMDRALESAEAGDTVLLSPAAASFDEFASFEDRGDRFKKWVLALEGVSE